MADLINGKGIFPSGGVPAANTQNAVQDIETVGCEALFYSTRCQVRFDAFSTNAIISEIAHVANCGGFKYDCSRLDNLCLGINGMIDNRLTGCLDIEFPDITGACSFKYLAIANVIDENGNLCQKISTYSPQSSLLGYATNKSVWGTAVGAFSLPRNPSDDNTFYWFTDLNEAVRSGTVNEAKLTSNKLVQLTVNIPCAQMDVELEFNQIVNFNPKINSGGGAMAIAVFRIDGEFSLGANNEVRNLGVYTNFERENSNTITVSLSQGAHTIEVFFCGYVNRLSPGGDPAQFFVNASENDSAASLFVRMI